MASLLLLFSELVRNHDSDAAALLAAYPPSSFTLTTSCASAAVIKPLKDEDFMHKNCHRTESRIVENPIESRVCVDLVWP
ncbi:hypothetical protein VNO78_16932 [Psophocarpus tetragonolobus]|uniref:Uncharacterized protein n=1 Tax=Psophocarpus tetragonolobus TaxID=3891 RepID=A0AAN9SIH3_PSOTE